MNQQLQSKIQELDETKLQKLVDLFNKYLQIKEWDQTPKMSHSKLDSTAIDPEFEYDPNNILEKSMNLKQRNLNGFNPDEIEKIDEILEQIRMSK